MNKQTKLKQKNLKNEQKTLSDITKLSKYVRWNIICKHRLLETKEAPAITDADPVSFINGKLGPHSVSWLVQG